MLTRYLTAPERLAGSPYCTRTCQSCFKCWSTCPWDPPPATVVIDSDPGYLAAFAGTCPAMTDATFILISLNGGTEHLVTYAKSLLWFVPPGGSMCAA